MCIVFVIPKGAGLKEKHTIVQLNNYVLNTYTSNSATCRPGNVALEELEFIKCPLLSMSVDMGPITRHFSGQLAKNCPPTHVPLVHLLPYNIQN